MNKSFFLITIFCLNNVLIYAQYNTQKIAEIDQYIEQSRKDWNVPGLAVAIVKDGKTLLAKGYGKKEVGTDQAVDEKTLFVNASTTKAMTAVAMGMLVDDGKIHWDDQVSTHMPEFQLEDPYASQELRVRELFTHNAGLGNADFLWVNNDLSADEILYQMRYLEPSYPFRGGYKYQNIMYLAAGKLIEKISGQSWSDFVQENIFVPLGMNRTFPLLSVAKKQDNISAPHYNIEDKITPIQDTNADAIGPAGSVWSCVEDMSKWMRFLLDSAKVDGGRLLKPETYKELFKPQIIIPYEQFYPSKQLTKPHWTTYAMGWFQHDYNGRFVSFHTGSLAGRVAILGLIPDENLGVFVYGNLSGAEVRHAIMYKVFDVFGEKDPKTDWSKELKAIYDEANKSYAKNYQNRLLKRVEGTQPSKALSDYTGIYSDEYFGKVKVELVNNNLVVLPSSKTELKLKHWHYNTFQGHYNRAWYGSTFVQFRLNTIGQIDRIEFDGMKFKKE